MARRLPARLAQLDPRSLPSDAFDGVAPSPRLRTLAVAGFALVLLVVLAGAVLGYVAAGRVAHYDDQVVRAHEAIEACGALLSTIQDAETGQRGYLLTVDEHYLEPYVDAVEQVQVRFERLKSLTFGSPGEQAALASLDKHVRDKLSELQQTVDLVQHGDGEAALDIVRKNVGKAQMDQIRDDIADLQMAGHEQLQASEAEADSGYQMTLLAILVPAITATLLLGSVSFLLQRGMALRERAAALLAEQGERLRTTLASIGDAVISTDAKGMVTYLNAVAESLTGWTTAQAQGQPLAQVFRIVNESTREPVPNPALRALGEGVIVGLANHTVLIARDGSERPIDDSAAPIRCKKGEMVGCVLVFRDVSSRRLDEQRLLNQSERLRKLAADLSDADRRKDEFLATLAHELRNPLAPIRNGLAVLRLSGDSAESVAQTRVMMERQLAHLVRLVDDLLDVSRISQGKVELRREPVSLAAVIANAVETSRPSIEAGGHQLDVRVPREPVHVEGDETRLAQVFANLLNNAAKYSEQGKRIELDAALEGPEVVVRVRDAGVGIPAEMLSRIFELFTQVDRSLERAQGGLGIGLTLVQRLVEMHGGSVEAHSDGAGRGSEFIVRLPAGEPPASPGAPRSVESPAASVRPLRILVADDNEDSAASLAMVLEIAGHTVRMANDGEQAVAVAADFRPDVVLLDIGMPRLNGYEACRRILEQPSNGQAVLIALTGWGQDEDRRRSLEAGFHHHLVKPVDPATLARLLAGRADGVG